MIMKNKFLFIIIIALTYIVSSNCFCDNLKNRLGIGLGYPYVSLKYGLLSNLGLELRGAFDIGIQIYGGRVYYNFNPKNKIVIYSGFEYDYLTYNTSDISGQGYLAVLFLGGEYFINKKLSLTLDFGPVYYNVAVNDNPNLVENSGSRNDIDWVTNVGIGYYFW